MDASFSLLHGHTRSMSSLASTIMPVSFEPKEWSRSTASIAAADHLCGQYDELRIPLPPSSQGSAMDIPLPASHASSECDGRVSVGDVDKEAELPGRAEMAPLQDVLVSGPLCRGKAPGLPPGGEQDRRDEGHVPDVEPVPEVPAPVPYPIDDLIQIMRKEAYETRRCQALKSRVDDLLGLSGANARLVPVQFHLYKCMVDCFRRDKKNAFASFYAQVELSRESSKPGRDVGAALPGAEDPRPVVHDPSNSWIHGLPSELASMTVDILGSLRTEPEFLAHRIARLSASQLADLTRPHRNVAAAESVLQPAVGLGRFDLRKIHRILPRTAENPKVSEDLQKDALFLLLHGIFDTSSRRDLQESQRRCDVWSTTCAHVIMDGKPGSNDFCVAILDAFANFYPWSIKPRLEIFLLDLIRSGEFISDSEASQPVDFSQPAELQNARIAVATSEFFVNNLISLLNVLTAGQSSVGIPRGSLDLIRATLGKIADPEKRTRARDFFVSRWYCNSFISNALMYPESHGLLMNCHIKGVVRQKLLRELAIRFQHQVNDALSPWKSPSMAMPAIQDGVAKLLRLFEPLAGDSPGNTRGIPGFDEGQSSHLSIGPQDVLSIVTALFPGDSSAKNTVTLHYDPALSTASSVTGSSTLTSITNEVRTGTASSTSPSVSGTSMTSNALSTEVYIGNLDKSNATVRNIEPGQPGEIKARRRKLNHRVYAMPTLVNALSAMVHGPTDRAILYIQEDGEELALSPKSDVAGKDHLPADALDYKTVLSEEDRALLVEAMIRVSHGSPPKPMAASIPPDHSLRSCFQTKLLESQSQFDFQSAHFWWRCITIVSELPHQSHGAFLQESAEHFQTKKAASTRMSKSYEDWLYLLQECCGYQEEMLEQLSQQCKQLRDKMWFISDVKHSSEYEDAAGIARALRAMSRTSQPRQTGMAAWARHRLRASFGQERIHAQTLDALSAPKEQGGPAKLADKQVELTSRWLTQDSIENFCKGEERIHRFCFEIQRCVRKLVGESLLESPVLWSSTLYSRERQGLGTDHGNSWSHALSDLSSWRTDFSYGHLHDPVPTSALSDQPLAYQHNGRQNTASSYGTVHYNRPSTAHTSSTLHESQAAPSHPVEAYATLPRKWTLPPSPISPTSMPLQTTISQPSPDKQAFLAALRETVTSLILSDLGFSLWNGGSETDRWLREHRGFQHTRTNSDPSSAGVWPLNPNEPSRSSSHEHPEATGVNNDIGCKPAKNMDQKQQTGAMKSRSGERKHAFPFSEAYGQLLTKFGLSSDPYVKLQCIYELTLLAASSQASWTTAGRPKTSSSSDSRNHVADFQVTGIRNGGVPRTKLTRLEEVIANCEERRLTSLKLPLKNLNADPLLHESYVPQLGIGNPGMIQTLQDILFNESLRPAALFRDLQFIASFVPSSILDHTPQGTAFWTAGLAALTVKSGACKSMTDNAAQILAYHLDSGNGREPIRTKPRGHVESPPKTFSLSAADLSRSTLKDAARLYTVSALEGDPTAARELALLYLTHPEIVRRVTLPLSKPSEIFRSSFLATSGERVRRNGREDGPGLDPLTFAVAFHWMEFAANAGDADARTFLKENGDLGRGW